MSKQTRSALLLLALLSAAGCGSHTAAAHKAVTPTTVPTARVPVACGAEAVGSGFTADPTTTTTTLQASDYSQAGDVQAALIYDGYRIGARSVYTNPSAAPGAPTLVECTDLNFATTAGATTFLGSWKELRQEDAPTVTQLTAALPRSTVAFMEKDQTFAAYKITSTNVLELAVAQGSDVYTASVAAVAPDSTFGLSLLKSMGVTQ